MKKCLVIDSYGFIFRAFHVQPSLTSPDGLYVGAIYGFTSMLLKLLTDQKPTHVVAVFDTGGVNFRHKIYPEYKKNRPPVPEELISQFALAREVVDALNITKLEIAGFEADDIIASVAKRAISEEEEVIIVSGDKDLAQLMDTGVKIYDPIKAKIISSEDIYTKFGVEPKYIRDFLALTGDSSDNIPGVPGFGPKTAAELINQFGNFENLCNNYHHIKSERKRNIFRDHVDQAKLSYELVGLASDMNLKFSIKDAAWNRPLQTDIKIFLDRYGFKSLISRGYKICTPGEGEVSNNSITQSVQVQEQHLTPSQMFDLAMNIGYCSIILFDNSFIVGCENCVCKTDCKEDLIELIEHDAVQKITYDIKELFKHFDKISSYEDLSLMSYILSAGYPKQNLEDLFIKYTQIDLIAPERMCINIHILRDCLRKELYHCGMLGLYLGIDLPISNILHKIEKNGVLLDLGKLKHLSEEFSEEIKNSSARIFEIAGREFNINSPKQLAEVLFEELKLPGIKKRGKTHALSTGAEVLTDLALKGYEIAEHLLYWRQISKLKNTYTDALPKLVDLSTSRIHTTLTQTSTSTGRLSSHDPNLQNIPVRTQEGARIRNAIIATPGSKLICADYSQVELRILAEIADIKELKEAFSNNIDIHTKTASQIFSIPLKDVTSEIRHKAKAINFGIIYGISSFGLSSRLGITKQDAANYIERYLKTYPGISEYMENTKNFAHKNGYVDNPLKRRFYLPQIKSNNFLERNFAERAAINAPIQGYASDIIKISMLEIDQILTNKYPDCKMILQIHDELLFECPEDIAKDVACIIENTMEHIVSFNPHLKVNIEISTNWS